MSGRPTQNTKCTKLHTPKGQKSHAHTTHHTPHAHTHTHTNTTHTTHTHHTLHTLHTHHTCHTHQTSHRKNKSHARALKNSQYTPNEWSSNVGRISFILCVVLMFLCNVRIGRLGRVKTHVWPDRSESAQADLTWSEPDQIWQN